jgi:hypothetical protein
LGVEIINSGLQRGLHHDADGNHQISSMFETTDDLRSVLQMPLGRRAEVWRRARDWIMHTHMSSIESAGWDVPSNDGINLFMV